MTKLLVLSLAETTSSPDGYAIIAKDIEKGDWIIIPSLSNSRMFIDGKAQWDLFAVTEAELSVSLINRKGIYDVITKNYRPKMITSPIKDNKKRIELLESLSKETKSEIVEDSQWVGILRNADIKNMLFHRRYTDRVGYDPERTFYWESRLIFSDHLGDTWKFKTPGVVCKDMRFKAYWKDLMLTREEEFEDSKEKWVNYMQTNQTYLLIEFIPNDYHGIIPMVSGVICINNEEEKNQ